MWLAISTLLLRCNGWLPGCFYAVARLFQLVFSTLFCCCKGSMGVAMQSLLLIFIAVLLRCYGSSPRCCYAVARVLRVVFSTLFVIARVLWVVAMQGFCNVVSKVFLIEFSALLLRCYGWSPGCCYAVARGFE